MIQRPASELGPAGDLRPGPSAHPRCSNTHAEADVVGLMMWS